MKRLVPVGGALLGAAILFGWAAAADAPSGLKSGLPVGDSPTPFHPLHVNGPNKGTKLCLV